MAEVTLEVLQTLSIRVLEEQQATRREMKDIRDEMKDMRGEMKDMRGEMKDMRREMGDVRGLVLSLSEKVTRLDRDLHEVKDDI
jgi:chromosome segregation ATPase